MPLQIEINKEFKQALDIICNTDKHIFITGKAGTGKSTFLNYCAENCKKNKILLAPTGVSALNIKGQTIHRFFGFPINITEEKIKNFEFQPRAKRIYKNLETLIIDEVSMLRADILDCINAFLQIYGPQPEKNFGGVQMVFVGDLYQLPPVISSQEQHCFSQKYTSPYFFDAEIFSKITIEVIELQKIYRQKDHDFITLLNRIRSNSVSKEDIVNLNSRLHISKDNAPNQTARNFQIQLTTTNQQADDINNKRLQQLEGITYSSQALIDGTFNKESYPAPEQLFFKLGSQIMFLNNDSKNRWVNGSLGYIEKISQENGKIKHLSVRLQDNSKLVEVFPYNWEIFKYTLEGNEIISEVAGSFTQYPFRLAWAVTIHKSQGKTFDNVLIDIGNGTFAPGQLYVALSRCTSFEGLELKRPITPENIMTDYRIFNFMSQYTLQELSEENRIHIFNQAIRKHQKLEIRYKKNNGEISQRIIIPLSIRKNNLLAYCTQRGEQRTFTLNNIQKAQILNKEA